MGKFNLIDEPWISVMINDKGKTKEVSLSELFQNASQYKCLAGDSSTQDFAVFRLLLAILHTVFSRFDAGGDSYDYFEVDDTLKQTSFIGEDDLDDYIEDLFNTWEDLWKMKEFPAIVQDYLNKWHDHFYLFDENYPFYQVTSKTMTPDKISKSKPSSISGKNINRLISESGNKVALFSPKYEMDNNKELLSSSEVARWLLTFQGYSGLSDKVIFGKDKYKASKGWLFDIGGIYLEGTNLFQSLLLNLVLVNSQSDNLKNIQKPCWEYTDEEVIKSYFPEKRINNVAELYTNWSRAIYVDPQIDIEEPFSCNIVKLPDIQHQDQFLEPMTTWRFNDNGENKDTYTPKKHQLNKAVWRSFGLITMPHSDKEGQRRPGVMDWLDIIDDVINNYEVKIHAVSMQDDNNATSWVPVNEICDYLKINELLLTDVSEDGWLPRINEAVETTKSVISFTYYYFLIDIRNLRQLSKEHKFVDRNIELLYYAVDQPFRDWLSSIQPHDSKAEKIGKWYSILKKIVNSQAEELLENATFRDYVGIEKDGKIENVITAHNKFKSNLDKKLGK